MVAARFPVPRNGRLSNLWTTAERVVRPSTGLGVATVRVASVVYLVGLVVFCFLRPQGAVDADAYWGVDLTNPYGGAVATAGAFLYPPPAALLAGALHAIPWPAFLFGWTLVAGLALYWLAGPWTLALVLIPFVWIELLVGNVHALLTVALVVAIDHPAAWAMPLLVKPTLGVGLLWHVARHEWRQLAIALGLTAAIAGVTLLVVPNLWIDWIARAVASVGVPVPGTLNIPLALRLPAAAALIWIGARRDWRWTVPVGGAIALPILWPTGLAILAGFGAVAALRRRPYPVLASSAS